MLSVVQLCGEDRIVELSPYVVDDLRVANPVPAGSFAAPVTLLRYEPRVDLQVRGFPEAQSDITIRGSVFEHSGVQVGALPLFDPQTGHYTAELPFDPLMVSAPEVITGVENALAGFNSNAGTVRWSWIPVASAGYVEVGVGDNGLNFQRAVAGETWAIGADARRRKIGVQGGFSRSEGNGSRPHMDHDFVRYSGRIQFRSPAAQTDLFAGYQSKFYGIPGGYTGNPDFLEADRYRVALFIVNHRHAYGEGSHWEAGVSHRRLVDDYELDRSRGKDFFRPFQHETEVEAAAVQGRHHTERWGVDYRAVALWDTIESTDLVHAGFQSRRYTKAAVFPAYRLAPGSDRVWTVGAGAAWDDTNRESSAVSPLALVSLEKVIPGGHNRYYAEYSGSSQVPGYTSKASSPPPGAFAGNAQLGRERTGNLEVGIEAARERITVGSALFYRRDRDLADWTFHSDAASLRQANPVDLDNYGWESLVRMRAGKHQLFIGYTALSKTADYGSAGGLVDGSYYAVNYARHRLTAAWVFEPVPGVELRVDTEARRQAENERRASSRNAFHASVGALWRPSGIAGAELRVTVDNITNSNFQDFPGTPPPRRQFSVAGAYAW